jgi:hypothetical protein
VALGTSVFPDGWAAFHAPVLSTAMTARVKVERVISEGKWNSATGDYDGGETELLYLGPADLDRIARPTRREFVSDSADNQMMQAMLPLAPELNEATPENLRWQSNDLLTVLVCSNPMMEGEKLFVRGWAGASEDWAHTLYCGFNSKQDGA